MKPRMMNSKRSRGTQKQLKTRVSLCSKSIRQSPQAENRFGAHRCTPHDRTEPSRDFGNCDGIGARQNTRMQRAPELSVVLLHVPLMLVSVLVLCFSFLSSPHRDFRTPRIFVLVYSRSGRRNNNAVCCSRCTTYILMPLSVPDDGMQESFKFEASWAGLSSKHLLIANFMTHKEFSRNVFLLLIETSSTLSSTLGSRSSSFISAARVNDTI